MIYYKKRNTKGDTMNETMMSKATFSEICKIMNHKDGKIHDCIKSVIRLSLLLFPGLMCKELATATALEAGLLKVDLVDVIDSTISSIKTAFGTKHEDFTTRAEDAQIAHVLIVFAAYFDSIKLYLPDANREFALNNKEKYALTEASIEEYITYLTEHTTLPLSNESFEVTDFTVPFPNPVEGFSASTIRLEKFYTILNSRFLEFVEQLSYIESIPGHKRDRFYATINAIPSLALDSYKKQYFELSALFPDFFVWTNQKEHEAIQDSIDVGFNEITKRFDNIAEVVSSSTAHRALSILHNQYAGAVKDLVVNKSEMPLGDNDVRLPSIETCFIPQAFRTLIYQENVSLNDADKWIERFEIGAFIADTLRSPDLGVKPLVILGDPGAGKTMLTRMLAAKILCNEYHVIILNLRNLNADNEIFEQINQQLSRRFSGMSCTWGDIIYSQLKKPILLIFDGYDELLQASGKTHSDYLERIARFQGDTLRESGTVIRTIVTSRIVLIDKARIPRGSVIVRLEKFDDQRIHHWCSIWNQLNSEYFARTGVKPFAVTPSSKSLNLATQPLLLLMLALFDSNDNALHRHQDLSAVELYNSLIRDFIVREQKKNPDFCKKENVLQNQIVDLEMERISIAALGMYNRNSLYIRSPQLQEDLLQLSTITTSGELQDSDKLLGSFFFLHRSDSLNETENGEMKFSAYEFLHNTFGEFLTAYYVTIQVCNLIKSIINSKDYRASLKKWYASLSYSPLFQRPVVADMISSWAPIYLKEKDLDATTIQDALSALIDNELPKILSGEIDSEITNHLQVFTSSEGYPKLDRRTHVAIYSINLISVLTLLLGELSLDTLEKHDNHAWDKLRHIWRYSFTEEDLAKFAYCFHVQHRESSRSIVRWISDISQAMFRATDFGPYKAYRTHLALDEKLEYSALGMFYGFDYKTVNTGLKRQAIPAKTWNAIKSIVYQPDIFSDSIQPQELSMLDNIFEFGMEEKDDAALVYGFLLLKYLSDPNNRFLLSPYDDVKYTSAGWLCHVYRSISASKNQTDKPIRLIILEILNQITLEIDTCEIICRELFPYNFKRDQFSSTELLLLSRLGRRIVDTYLEFCEPLPLHLFDSYVKRLADSFEMICKWTKEPIDDNIIEAVLLTTVQIMRHCEDDNVCHILLIFKDYLERIHGHEDFFITTKQAALLIDALALYHKDEDDGTRLATELMPYIMGTGMRVIDLFDQSPYSVESLCFIISRFPHDIGIPLIPMLVALADERADSISFGTYKSLLRISKEFDANDLHDALARNLN